MIDGTTLRPSRAISTIEAEAAAVEAAAAAADERGAASSGGGKPTAAVCKHRLLSSSPSRDYVNKKKTKKRIPGTRYDTKASAWSIRPSQPA